jgi:cytochrome b
MSTRRSAIKVWDPVVRIAHWSIAILVAANLLNEPGANPVHRAIGYAIGALLAARLAWGLVGPSYARLAAIARRAALAAAYLVSPAARAEARAYPGLNPLGAAMALLLWALLLVSIATGWMLQLDDWRGDEDVGLAHAVSSYALGGCAIAHVLGVLATSALQRVNLVKAMITGRKALPGEDGAG